MMSIIIRSLTREDIPALAVTAGRGAAWHGGGAKWERRVIEQEEGRRIVLIAEQDATPIGYGSLIRESDYPPFRTASIPEVNDLVVAEGSRRQGVGTRIIHALERAAMEAGCSRIGIGVGLYQDYGPAQRLYVRLGYIPDGQGVTYHNAPVVGGAAVQVDDDLVLWLVKPLENS